MVREDRTGGEQNEHAGREQHESAVTALVGAGGSNKVVSKWHVTFCSSCKGRRDRGRRAVRRLGSALEPSPDETRKVVDLLWILLRQHADQRGGHSQRANG